MAGTRSAVREAIVKYLASQGGLFVTCTGNVPPSFPLTVTSGVDEFHVQAPGEDALTFQIPVGTYSDIAQLCSVFNSGAVLQPSLEPAYDYFTMSNAGGLITLTAVDQGYEYTNAALTEGNGGAALLGFTGSDTFANPSTNIEYLNAVYGFPLKFTPEPAFYNPNLSNESDGAIIWLYMPDQDDHRTAFGGEPGALQGGEKQRTRTIQMDIIFKSSAGDAQVVGLDNEAFLDDLVDAICADRTAGTDLIHGDGTGTIFQWGEGRRNAGETDIHVSSDYPVPILDDLSVVYSKVLVTVVQILEQT